MTLHDRFSEELSPFLLGEIHPNGRSADLSEAEAADDVPKALKTPKYSDGIEAADVTRLVKVVAGAKSGFHSPKLAKGESRVQRVIIHVLVGNFGRSLTSWSTGAASNPPHYVISKQGTIAQLVAERLVAYHANSANNRSIGIEHDGYYKDRTYFTDAMVEASAELVADICDRHSIPIDREHIIGHDEVWDTCHGDPGGYWDWDYYMALVRHKAGKTKTRPTRLILTAAAVKPGADWSKKERDPISHGPNSSKSWGKWYWKAASSKTATDVAQFSFVATTTGFHDVSLWFPASKANCSAVKMTVAVDGITLIQKSIDQRKARVRKTCALGNTPTWRPHGGVMAMVGSKVVVEISRQSSEQGAILADAVRLLATDRVTSPAGLTPEEPVVRCMKRLEDLCCCRTQNEAARAKCLEARKLGSSDCAELREAAKLGPAKGESDSEVADEMPFIDESPFADEMPFVDESPFADEMPFVDEVDAEVIGAEVIHVRADENEAYAGEVDEESNSESLQDEPWEAGETHDEEIDDEAPEDEAGDEAHEAYEELFETEADHGLGALETFESEVANFTPTATLPAIDATGVVTHAAPAKKLKWFDKVKDDTRTPTHVLIHVLAGSYSNALAHAKDGSWVHPAHYVVSSTGDVAQLVAEKFKAPHGNGSNPWTVGIEHDGFMDDPKYYTDTMLVASASLVRSICDRHGITKDRAHVVGHEEVWNATHGDPGSFWDWDYYMALVRWDGRTASTRPYRQVLAHDASSRSADWKEEKRLPTKKKVQKADGEWTVKQDGPHYAHSYQPIYVRAPASTTADDPVTFNGRVDRAGWTDISVWFPVVKGNCPHVSYRVFVGKESTPRIELSLDQSAKKNGLQPSCTLPGRYTWRSLGVLELKSSDTVRVEVSRKSPKKGKVAADAVRLLQCEFVTGGGLTRQKQAVKCKKWKTTDSEIDDQQREALEDELEAIDDFGSEIEEVDEALERLCHECLSSEASLDETPELEEDNETKPAPKLRLTPLKDVLAHYNRPTGLADTPKLHQLIDRYRAQVLPDVPLELLVAFSAHEGGTFEDATHGRSPKFERPPFYEIGVFQVPAGLHGKCTSKQHSSCEIKPPGTEPKELKERSQWARFAAALGLDPENWQDPTTQVRIGLAYLFDHIRILKKKFPDGGFDKLFPKPGSDFYLRAAVLLPHAGIGTTYNLLKQHRAELEKLPDDKRWAYLTSQKLSQAELDGIRNVEPKMIAYGELNLHFAKESALKALRGIARIF